MQTRCCGSITCCVGMCCGAVARCTSCDTPSHCSTTQHDMLPQHLVCKYELNYEYRNITLARNKAPWWWSDKIETCRSVLKCFKSVLYECLCPFFGWFVRNSFHSKKNWAKCDKNVYWFARKVYFILTRF